MNVKMFIASSPGLAFQAAANKSNYLAHQKRNKCSKFKKLTPGTNFIYKCLCYFWNKDQKDRPFPKLR